MAGFYFGFEGRLLIRGGEGEFKFGKFPDLIGSVSDLHKLLAVLNPGRAHQTNEVAVKSGHECAIRKATGEKIGRMVPMRSARGWCNHIPEYISTLSYSRLATS